MRPIERRREGGGGRREDRRGEEEVEEERRMKEGEVVEKRQLRGVARHRDLIEEKREFSMHRVEREREREVRGRERRASRLPPPLSLSTFLRAMRKELTSV